MIRLVVRGASAALVTLVLAGGAGAQQVVDLPAQDKALSADLESVFSIGAFDGAEWETFGEIASVGFDAQGRLYVFDRQSSRIVVVDAEGGFVRQFGEAGEGPGELRMPAAMVVMHDGSVVIADVGHRAYSLFGPTGEYQRMVSMGGDGGMIRIGQLIPDPRGGGIISGGGNQISMSFSSGPGGAGPAQPTSRPIEHVSLAGETAQTRVLAQAWLPPRPPPGEMSGGGMTFRMGIAGPRAFEPGLLVGALPGGGFAFADSSTYAVKVAGSDGTVGRVIRRPLRPKPVTKGVQDTERARRLEELEAGEGPRVRLMTTTGGGGSAPRAVSPDAVKEMMRNQIEQLQFFEELPILFDMRAGWEGKLWAVRRGEKPNEPGAIDVITPGGEYLGTFRAGSLSLPSAFGPDGLVAFIETGELDVPTVVVKRLPAALR